MSKKQLMHAMSMQEKKEVNGGSATLTLWQVIKQVINGNFTPMV